MRINVCIDEKEGLYEPIYIELKNIYQRALNVIINGEEYKNPESLLKLNMLPEEYMAIHYDFFEMYNADSRIKRKKELQEEIVYKSQGISQSLKEIIEQIVKVYEVEIL